MKQLITKINREKGYTYRVDQKGNIYKESYNFLKDPYTLVMIAILILGILYYLQISQMKTTEANFQSACEEYQKLKIQWLNQYPGQIPSLEDVLSVRGNDNYDG